MKFSYIYVIAIGCCISLTSSTDEKVHLKIHVPYHVNHHHHTKLVLVPAKKQHHHHPHGKPHDAAKGEDKKHVVIHKHQHHHKHDHKHAHKHKHEHPKHHKHHHKKPHHKKHHKKHYRKYQRIVRPYYRPYFHALEDEDDDLYHRTSKTLNSQRYESEKVKDPVIRRGQPVNLHIVNTYGVTENRPNDFTSQEEYEDAKFPSVNKILPVKLKLSGAADDGHYPLHDDASYERIKAEVDNRENGSHQEYEDSQENLSNLDYIFH